MCEAEIQGGAEVLSVHGVCASYGIWLLRGGKVMEHSLTVSPIVFLKGSCECVGASGQVAFAISHRERLLAALSVRTVRSVAPISVNGGRPWSGQGSI